MIILHLYEGKEPWAHGGKNITERYQEMRNAVSVYSMSSIGRRLTDVAM